MSAITTNRDGPFGPCRRRPVLSQMLFREDRAGAFRAVDLPSAATREEVDARSVGELLPFEASLFEDGVGEFPSQAPARPGAPPRSPSGFEPPPPSFHVAYTNFAVSWLFGFTPEIGYRPGLNLQPFRRSVYRFRLLPVAADPAMSVHDGRPLVSLPPPEELAALLGHRRFVTGGGDWMVVHLLDDGRALFVGCDLEDRGTAFGRAYLEDLAETETDLLAGAPRWWGITAREHHPGAFRPHPKQPAEFEPITLIFGWEDGHWTRAVGAPDESFILGLLDDGLENVGHYSVDE